MQIGMLWFDNNDSSNLEEKLEKAAAYYESKHGSRPTICHMHPSMLGRKQAIIEGLRVIASNRVLPHHFWLGLSEESETQPAA